jgi:hypothetical protein
MHESMKSHQTIIHQQQADLNQNNHGFVVDVVLRSIQLVVVTLN